MDLHGLNSGGGATSVDPRVGSVSSEATLRADTKLAAGALGAGTTANEVLHPLRPMRVTEALDLGFTLFKVQARILIPIATVLYLPIQVVNLLLRLANSGHAGATVLTTSGVAIAGIADVATYEPFILLAQSLALSILGLCSGHMTAALIERRASQFGETIRFGLSRIWVAAGIVVLSAGVYLVLSIVPVVGWLIAGSFTFIASVIAGAERLGPWMAIRRNIAFGRSRNSPAINLYLGGLVLLALTRAVLLAGPVALVFVLGGPESLIEALASASAILLVIVQPLTATFASSAYVMLRIRSEGMDLEQRIVSGSDVQLPIGAPQ
ncbi:MAG: hypothetical protein KDB26_01340 [Microthrixaceae bacterium]|nr:hypothetical protein [Microthrixaceae bacterium]